MQKNQLIICCLIATTAFFYSCKKSFLEQANPNAVSIDKNFQTENDIALAVNGVYQGLRSSNAIGEGARLWTDDRSDDYNSTDDQSNNGEPFQFTAFSLVSSNTYLQSHWSALYTPISRANLVLSVIDKIAFASDSVKSRYIAEVKYIRALMYFHLVREFGGVPLVTTRLGNASEVDAITFRATREEVYAQIIKDLTDVTKSNLPAIQPPANKGRVSLQAANGLLGQVYLHMGATLDADNASHFNNAKTYLTACYNMRTFGQLSEIPFADVFDVSKKSVNPEIIMQIVYRQGDQTYSSSIASGNQARGETINSQFLSQGSGVAPSQDLVKEFETGDIRTTYSIKYSPHPSVQNYFYYEIPRQQCRCRHIRLWR